MTVDIAIAHALYDTFHTARLSEHPEDLEQYTHYAEVFGGWLNVHGFQIIAAIPELSSCPTSVGSE